MILGTMPLEVSSRAVLWDLDVRSILTRWTCAKGWMQCTDAGNSAISSCGNGLRLCSGHRAFRFQLYWEPVDWRQAGLERGRSKQERIHEEEQEAEY